MQCTTCSGLGFVLVERPKYWHQSGTSAVIGTQKVSEICDECHGLGLMADPAHNPNCTRCAGIGTMTVSDGHGGVEFDKCPCENPAHRNPLERELLGLEVA